MGSWTLIKCTPSFGDWAFGSIGTFKGYIIVLRHSCLPSALLLITKEKREINHACSLAECSRSESWPQCASLSDTVQVFWIFSSYCTYMSTTQAGRKLFFPNQKMLFPSITSVFTSICLLLCTGPRHAFSYTNVADLPAIFSLPFSISYCMMRSKRLTELGIS